MAVSPWVWGGLAVGAAVVAYAYLGPGFAGPIMGNPSMDNPSTGGLFGDWGTDGDEGSEVVQRDHRIVGAASDSGTQTVRGMGRTIIPAQSAPKISSSASGSLVRTGGTQKEVSYPDEKRADLRSRRGAIGGGAAYLSRN